MAKSALSDGAATLSRYSSTKLIGIPAATFPRIGTTFVLRVLYLTTLSCNRLVVVDFIPLLIPSDRVKVAISKNISILVLFSSDSSLYFSMIFLDVSLLLKELFCSSPVASHSMLTPRYFATEITLFMEGSESFHL